MVGVGVDVLAAVAVPKRDGALDGVIPPNRLPTEEELAMSAAAPNPPPPPKRLGVEAACEPGLTAPKRLGAAPKLAGVWKRLPDEEAAAPNKLDDEAPPPNRPEEDAPPSGPAEAAGCGVEVDSWVLLPKLAPNEKPALELAAWGVPNAGAP